ncbi:MAG: hypothetical protein DRG27_02660 [Deltaproteobacteria bacterium]|nr:MAG: hypothetical protein DRG27_02660 [Deltaproteobacteria bacterium]
MASKDKEEKREKEVREQVVCPIGRLFADFFIQKDSPFFEHINRSKIEFLKAIKSIIDQKIEQLEKRTEKKKATKIEVE